MGSMFVPSTSHDKFAGPQRGADTRNRRHEMPQSIDSSLATQGLADEQRGLLDLVDKLQFAQLDNVKLPQIVVVGDQSAGKSSVLEALSGTPFPRDAGACTRFATEIRLRRAKEASLKVSIIPDKGRPFNDQQRLLQWGGSVTGDVPFETMMRGATELIAPKDIPGRFAARDILVVEKSGPEMPLLTLVDLPGLVRVANRDQSDADIQTIDALSDRYMKSSRTIILAVVGGNNDYVQAPILKKARHFDPRGSRTIGVLTKPDMTERIGLEDKFIELVTNQDRENNFKLGWYVLLNPGPGEDWPSPEDRLRREAEFFTRGKWATLPPQMWGIASLRQKLSTQLQRHIGKHVKSLRRQIQQSLENCEAQLKAMGAGKDTVEEMRFEMGELFASSGNLVTPAVNGNYKNPFGDKFFSRQPSPKGTPSQKLRARVREESDRFARRFRQHGRKVQFGGADRDGGGLPAAGAVNDPSKKAFAQNEVEPLLRQIRGNELPLDSNPRAPYILFQDYSRNWPVLAQEYKENLGVICNEFLADVIDHVWPMRMRDPLRFHFLEIKMKECMENADKELGRLTDDMELEIQPFDPEYEDRLRAWRAAATENGGTYTEAEEVLEKMLIYYDLTARIFVRNVVTQVVERHLLLGMLRLFNPIEILRMPDHTIEAIAAENKETRDRRLALKQQKEAIEEARNICASLAMRSELRAYEDEPEDEVSTDDEGEGQPPTSSAPQRQSRAYQHIPRQNSEAQSARRVSRNDSVRTPTTPQPESYPAQTNGAHALQDPIQPSWDQPHYTTAQAHERPPAHAPPPPPRPSKIGLEEAERFHDAMPRAETAAAQSGGRGNRDSARHRLANVMKLGSQQQV
ncbi:Interferon-induced GTP-binding protein Mx-like protein [Hapsidospora chrysogenum ATCC 11550]|uniref:Interferon-induced GTP-binding protein Mx-like protein n=1 Tax=Hapsidospora chrysogenum (strain ATCC 11550 / CBS 779.69 / DSM 880 / IAM 14645 / JCM 23072 / IMI 49137) TaxID=857340 RepID=A0A086THE6_HAPC1|nr:Interferon-induced GTP-binding protein Mx-like protein [Hapsidospora chrysogenum ATCC 11550]